MHGLPNLKIRNVCIVKMTFIKLIQITKTNGVYQRGLEIQHGSISTANTTCLQIGATKGI